MTRRSCVVLCVRERVREIVKWQPDEEEEEEDAAEEEENDGDAVFCGSGSMVSHGRTAAVLLNPVLIRKMETNRKTPGLTESEIFHLSYDFILWFHVLQ